MDYFPAPRTLPMTVGLRLIGILGMLTVMGNATAAGEYEALWLHPSAFIQGEKVNIGFSPEPVNLLGSPQTFSYKIQSDVAFEKVVGKFCVLDDKDRIVHQGQTLRDLLQGENHLDFLWDPASLAPGSYRIEFQLRYALEAKQAVCNTPSDRVSAAGMRKMAESIEAHLLDLSGRIDQADGTAAKEPYLGLRLRLAKDAVDTAKQALQDENWRQAHNALTYAGRTASAIDSGLVFLSSAPELSGSIPPLAAKLSMGDGGITSGDRQILLVGSALSSDPDKIEKQLDKLAQLGMNFAVLPVDSISSVVASPFDEAAIRNVLEPMLKAAARNGVALVIQISQEALANAVKDQAPDIFSSGFANMAHPALRAAIERHIQAIGEVIRGNDAVMGLSLALAPAFKFDGDSVRQQFIEKVKAAYPDRQELNQAWRAHLANYDEITIWGDHPKHSYQNRRAYQFDWQSFHRDLVNAYISSLKETVASFCPGVPISITLADSAFELGETKYSADRERTSKIMDFSACTLSVGAKTGMYGIDYPRAEVGYVLCRSLAPEKPVLNLSAGLGLTDDLGPGRCYGVVRTVLWEALVSGVSGLAFAADSELFSRPEATEAAAVTALDARRLAKEIHAFQKASSPIQVLYSESSKILDNGEPHLKSCWYAFEGSSFSGHNVRFVTESQIAAGALSGVKVLVMPETPASTDAAFKQIDKYVTDGGVAARVGTPIPYNERGHSRNDVVRATGNTVYVQGMNMPTEYLHTTDTKIVNAVLPQIPRPINKSGYPLEGVRTCFVELDGVSYLYIVNLRSDRVMCSLSGGLQSGRDLIQGRDVGFPRHLEPMDPMLIKMNTTTSVVNVP